MSKVFDDQGFVKKRMGNGTWYCIAYEEPSQDLNDDSELEVSAPKLPF